jgi:hypothetical protein
LTGVIHYRTISEGKESHMTDLRALALSLDESAPDRKIAAIMEREREKIEEALKTVGEYVLSDDEGRIYIITASKPPATEQPQVVVATG